MKKIIIIASALFLLTSYSANAQVSVTLGAPVYYGAPPIYYPPPVYAPGYVEYYQRYPSMYYDRRGHHRHDDWAYWANERRGHDNRNHDHR